MPYINVSVPQKLTDETVIALKSELGQAISLIPGKNESVLMIIVEDGKKIFFGGDAQGNEAFVDVRVYGKCELGNKRLFTETVYEIFGRLLGTAPGRMFLNFTEHDSWGIRGSLK